MPTKRPTRTTTTPARSFNCGFWDALADQENGRRDRRNVPQGSLFSLPAWDRDYREGYATGYEHGTSAKTLQEIQQARRPALVTPTPESEAFAAAFSSEFPERC